MRNKSHLPLLDCYVMFLLYINDLPHALNMSSISMYADDTSLRSRSKDLKALNIALNEDLQRLDY